MNTADYARTLERIASLLREAERLESIHCPRCAANRRYEAAKLEREITTEHESE